MRTAHVKTIMKIAIPIWQGRVSPVFDVAGHLLLAEAVDGAAVRREVVPVPEEQPRLRARQLADLQVDVLVCGAISRPMQAILAAAGIDVLPWVCGDAEEILEAYLSGRLPTDEFLMPGCCGRHQWRRHRRGGCRPGRGGPSYP
jgi:predicted Fe-Mo cluster-binding NifX family protein